jgi:transposase-like protein
VNVDGWCGHCGESFRLAQVVEEGSGGRCPRCGISFSHEYNAVITTAVTQLLAAAAVLDQSAQQIADAAPLLHVDRDSLYKQLDQHLHR